MERRWLGAGGMLQDVALVTGRRSHPLCCLLPQGDSETPPPEQALLGQPACTSASPPSPSPPLTLPPMMLVPLQMLSVSQRQGHSG